MKAIQATPESIDKILRNHEFVIPAYQRPYSWDKDECEQLWADLEDFFDTSNSTDTYFLGSIVVYPDASNKKLWEVIDGQQRLTTILILIRAFLKRASTHSILEKIIFKEDSKSGEAIKGEPRLTSNVQQGGSRAEDLKKVLSGRYNEVSETSLVRSNYDIFDEKLEEWWEKKDTPTREKIISALQDRVVMLPIECASQDDALNLFEIINIRGKPLNAADIFKAKIFDAVPEKDREDFINRWDSLESGAEEKSPGEKHIEMFRIYMHISRAERGISSGEINIRDYMEKHHLRDTKALSKNWRDIMGAMEACNFVSEHSASDEASETAAEEKIYRCILKELPNQNWQYPLYVFLNKYMTRNGDNFALPANKHADYVALLRNTVRYFYLKAVVHKTVSSVRGATYNAYAAIAKGKDYVAEYYKNAGDDIDPFLEKLRNNDLGRCLKGLVFLSASLNPEQNRRDCGDVFQGKPQQEHILPKKWNDYDKWTAELHKEAVGKIGNLMPLEYRVNIAASNEFFARKQDKYRASNMQDALELSKQSPSTWYPDDIEKRQDEVVKRLEKFFTDPEFSGR